MKMKPITRRQWLAVAAAFGLRPRLEADVQDQPQPAHYHYLLNASINQKPGVPFRLAAAVLRPGIKERCRNRISFSCSDPQAVLPAPYEFSSQDDLYESHLFQVTLRSPGNHTVSMREEKTGREFTSNTVVCTRQELKLRLCFGDIHIHSEWSIDGRKSADYNYIYVRDAMNLDFACLTEHDPTDQIWEMVKAKARELYQPGRFATMSAYEWTGHLFKAGHKNVYYRDWEGPILRSNFTFNRNDRTAHTTSAADLWAQLRKHAKPVMTIPHHPASKVFPVPWDQYDPEFQRAVEIYSGWGSSEYLGSPRVLTNRGNAPGHFVQDGLAAGQRLGFVGGSDSHSGRPGYTGNSRAYCDGDYADWQPNRPGGTTGVYVEELSREAIFDAIHKRRCYATTGVRIILDFKADGHWMGEGYSTRHAPHLQVRVWGTAPLESVTVVKNNQDYYRVAGKGRDLQFELAKTERPKDTDYYYMRVIQQDGELAWSYLFSVMEPFG